MNRGLYIKPPWTRLIFEGLKTWEIRSQKTNIRGEIGIIESGTGSIIGSVNLVDCIELTPAIFFNNFNKHQIPESFHKNKMIYTKTFAWVLENPILFQKPIPVKHKQGAIIWLLLEKDKQ